MEGILNEHTATIHKREVGTSDVHTVCGATYHVAPDQLLEMSVERAAVDHGAEKCGRCFEGSGGY